MNKKGFQIIKKAPVKKEYKTEISKWKETHKNQYAIAEINPDNKDYGRILVRSSTPLHMDTFDLDMYDADEENCIEIYADNPRLKESRPLTSEEVKKIIKIVK